MAVMIVEIIQENKNQAFDMLASSLNPSNMKMIADKTFTDSEAAQEWIAENLQEEVQKEADKIYEDSQVYLHMYDKDLIEAAVENKHPLAVKNLIIMPAIDFVQVKASVSDEIVNKHKKSSSE